MAQPTGSRYELVKLKEVNTYYNEGAPIISPDGNTLYFFVDGSPQNTLGKEGTQDIWMSKKDASGVWSAPKHLTAPFNQNKLNQVFTVFADGSIFIRGNRTKNAVGFSVVSPNGAWKELNVKDFDRINKGQFWGASMSADMKHMILYFSEIAGSLRSDLYTSHQLPDGSWSRPVKMALSTNLDDFGPFISPDQKTLFFASDSPRQGRQGLIDIYRVERLDESWNNWGPPMNVGKPLNTSAEDDYFSMDASGNVFVARSNSKQDGGNLDIFILVRKDVNITLNGVVYNNKSKQPLNGALVDVTAKGAQPLKLKSDASGKFTTHLSETSEYSIAASAAAFSSYSATFPLPKISKDTTINTEIFLDPDARALVINGTVTNKKTGESIDAKVVITGKSDKTVNLNPSTTNGAFSQGIAKTGWYMFTVSREGFLNGIDSLNYDNDDVTPMTKDIALQPIEVGTVVRLKNIYFDFSKATLKAESYPELEKVVTFLNENPTVEIEIQGHTDSVGPDDRNQALSQGRSQSVVDYLVGQGISGDRLKAQGFGESKPIDTNDTAEGRANNRRVEFTVLKM
jgi:outer membrane protein OmpA-like peptidoglycan-associated protein